jgi:hypothetical protein
MLAVLVLGALLYAGAAPSGATFTAASASPHNDFAAAADFNTVAVSLADPVSPAAGIVALSATARSDRGIDHVTFQRADAGGWTDVCTDTDAPSACDLDTTAAPDGALDVRAVAVDAAGYSRSATKTLTVDNTAPTAAVTAPSGPLTGSTTVTGSATDAGSGIDTAKLQYRRTGDTGWTDMCATTTCTWNTAALADGSYDLRIHATDRVGNAGDSPIVSGVIVDNTAPTVTVTNPGAAVSGTVTVRSSSADGSGSGVTAVQYLYRTSGGGAWTQACRATSAPFSCSWSTTGLTDGSYDLEAIATDGVNLQGTSAVIAGVTVDNTPPTASPTSPSGPIRGQVSFDPGVHDADVVSVDYDGRPAGTTTWYPFTTLTTAPFTLTGNTTTVPDGVYELRAVVKDRAGNQTIANFPGTITIDNTAPHATDVQAANGGAAGRLDANDTLTFTYSEPIAPASIDAGWDGTAKAVTVTVAENGAADTLEVYDGATRVALTSPTQPLQLNADWVSATTSYPATMTRTGSTVKLTFGTPATDNSWTGVSTPAAMTWTPSTAATDLAGNPATATAATESGASDVDF